MPKTNPHHLLIGSITPYSGKSTAVVGIAQQLRDRGIEFAYGKPVGTCVQNTQENLLDEDTHFITQMFQLPPSLLRPTLVALDTDSIHSCLLGRNPTVYKQELVSQYSQVQTGDLALVEGPGSLEEGLVFGLSLPQVAEMVEGRILLVGRGHSLLIVDSILAAKAHLGDRLLGVLLNDIPQDQWASLEGTAKPFLENQGIPVLGLLPSNALLRSVSVAELVKQLNAEVLCRSDRLDLMVEQLAIGAMNVNSALKYFRKGNNMAVITGGGRTDIQLAALESSTHCLILTGQFAPDSIILERAEDLEIPVLLVDLDTLTTTEIVDRAFGKVRVHEVTKVRCIQQMIATHFDMDRLLNALGLEPAMQL